ncbi:type III-A CRISPR-associated protein Csm2 [Streptococcus timonensis]|jgi:CRISPR-associated protein, csm2 family|uniref:type III-A CRISPR-associated protein Csm2 n=1 Tax=Streptococcus timonensis TaxID=1852387 RepID=UPI0039C3D513
MMFLTDDNYVDKAENVINSLKRIRKKNNSDTFFLTTSKIRKLLSLTSTLYDESRVREYDDLKDKIAYLKVQYIYQAGKEPSVKDLVIKGEIIEALNEIKDRESLQRFCRYMEALVAYFKFYEGEEQ